MTAETVTRVGAILDRNIGTYAALTEPAEQQQAFESLQAVVRGTPTRIIWNNFVLQ